MLYRVTFLRKNGCVLKKSEVEPAVIANLVWKVAAPWRGNKHGRFVEALMVEGSSAWQQGYWPPLFDPQVTLIDEGMAISGTQFSHAEVNGESRRHEHNQVWWCERATDAEVAKALVWKPKPKDPGPPGVGGNEKKPAPPP